MINTFNYKVFKDYKICFKRFDYIIYVNILRDKVIIKDNINTYYIYYLKSIFDDDKNISGNIELYFTILNFIKNDYSLLLRLSLNDIKV
jgi:hypothetical protein